MATVAIYAGTFDPITNGHVDIVMLASALFDQVIIGIAQSARKTPCVPLEDRIQLCQKVFSANAKIHVGVIEKLALDFAREHKATYLIRGVRGVSDFDYEMQMAAMNHQMAPEIETIFLPATSENAFVSSTMVREIISLGREVSGFVPKAVAEYFEK
jgi:pantetheine-phosphate adenylyltransferase